MTNITYIKKVIAFQRFIKDLEKRQIITYADLDKGIDIIREMVQICPDDTNKNLLAYVEGERDALIEEALDDAFAIHKNNPDHLIP